MSEPSYGIGYLTPAEQRQAELIVKENAMLGTGASNPNFPGNYNAEHERMAEERDVDALLLLAASTIAGNLETFLNSLTPGTEAQSATYDALDMAQTLQAHLLEQAQALSPESFKDFCRREAAESMAGFMDELRGMGRR